MFCCQLQVKCLCVLLFLSFPLTMTEVPGPCRHSITREHLLTVRHLVGVKTNLGWKLLFYLFERNKNLTGKFQHMDSHETFVW